MSVERVDEVLSGVESLPCSPPPVSLPLSSSSSPLSSSRQVTARLYSSLQQSREQESRLHTCAHPLSARQVSFKLSAKTSEEDLGLDARSTNEDAISGGEEAESDAEPTVEEILLQSGSAKLSAGRRHIKEMENVRTHLQTMLRASPGSTDTHELLPPGLYQPQDNSYGSDATSHLLSGMEDLFPRYSRLRTDFDSATFHSISELQVIRESLERERARRKHSEQQLLALQNKMLELQQQLALAVSADRKKDIMIEQLDKTLEKVVEGWRRHEQEKSEGMRRLQEEKEAAEGALEKQRQALAGLERSLSEAAETLDKEQKRNEVLQNANKQLECDVGEVRVCKEQLQQQVEQNRAEITRLQTLSQSLQDQLQQHHLQAKHTHTQLQQDITQLTQQLETERERVQQEVQQREDVQSRLQQIQQDLEETRRERDAARVDRALDQARFEAQRSQWEVELRLTVEQQVTQRLASIQEENANAMAKLREQHRKQLIDLSAHHERELSAQTDEFRAQLQERDERLHQHTLQHNNRMSELQDQMVSMETSKRKLEMQREELVSRLQGMMRSHWAEALRLLTNQEQNEALLSQLSPCDKPHTDPPAPDTCISTGAPQAVVLHLSRDRETRGPRDTRVERGRSESECSLLNHSQVFTPLEPVLDDTHLTAVGGSDVTDLWDRHLVQKFERERETVGQRSSDHFHPFSETNQIRSQIRNQIHLPKNKQDDLIPHRNPNLTLRANRLHPSTEGLTNQSCSVEKGVGRGAVSMEKYDTRMNDPPIPNQSLPIKERAPPTVTGSNASSVCEERRGELHYYITKLLERSPGDPLEENDVDQGKARAETQPGNSGPQTELKLEQLADLLHQTLGPSHTNQHVQQLLHTLLRSEQSSTDPVRTNLDRKLTQHDKRERPTTNRVQSCTSRGRRSAPPTQRSGSKTSAWR